MAVDPFTAAQRLQVIDVWKFGNPTGYVTPPVLYDPRLKMAPKQGTVQWWLDHGTVGTNTLRFWGTNGSINNGTYSLAHYLVPHNTTEYADGRVHDTSNVVFKMVPDGYSCNHTGPCIEPVSNVNALGVEYESRQNGTHDIDEEQYIKGALLFANAAARYRIRDYFRVPHGLVAVDWGRRTDPWAGLFNIAYSWELVQAIRRDGRIWQMWGLPQPARGL